MASRWLKKKEVLVDKRPEEKTLSMKAGLPPGTLVHLGEKKLEIHKITVINYDEGGAEEIILPNIEDCTRYIDNGQNTWINFDGINHVDKVEKLGTSFGVHMLLLEDVVNTEQRPKMEIVEDHVFLIIKMLEMKNAVEGKFIDSEQVSFVLGKGWLLSFQEDEGDVFEVVRKRIQNPNMRIRKQGTDYLLYRLVDTIVDNYYVIAEYIGDKIEALEEEILENPGENLMWKVQNIRKDIMKLRKAVMPLREAIGRLAKEDNKFIRKSTMKYFHDTYEHTIHLNDFIETQRDLLASLVELFNSGVGQKMNQIMKVLTMIATIFIPLTFIAGIYGMNFDNMPELRMKNGYYATMAVMAVIGIVMLLYFRKKKWL